MADPTNPNDPAYTNNPHYVWSGGRWQYVSNPATANDPSTAPTGHVQGSVTWTGIPSGHSVVKAMGGDINNFAGYQDLAQRFREGAIRQQANNPYNTGIADQSRAAQLALIQQMRAQQAGPSLAALQGQRGMAQAGQQALMMGGRAGMLGAQNASTGMAGDMGQARLAEIMRSQAGMGGAAGNLRGADLRSAEAQAGTGIKAQSAADQSAQFYAQLGAMLDQARARQALENFKLGKKVDANVRGIVMNGVNQGVGGLATAATSGVM